MKKLIIMVLCAFMLASSAGCGAPSAPPAGDVPVPSVSDAPDNDFGITLTADQVTPTGLTIVCTQSGGEVRSQLLSGSYYILERHTIDGWIPLKYANEEIADSLAWTAEGWIIEISGTVRWQQNWEWLYGELSPGWYRIGKEILSTGTDGLEKQMSYAVFSIEE